MENLLDRITEIEFSLICLEDAIQDRDKVSWDYYRSEFYRLQGQFLTELRQEDKYEMAKLYEDLFHTKYGIVSRRWHESLSE